MFFLCVMINKTFVYIVIKILVLIFITFSHVNGQRNKFILIPSEKFNNSVRVLKSRASGYQINCLNFRDTSNGGDYLLNILIFSDSTGRFFDEERISWTMVKEDLLSIPGLFKMGRKIIETDGYRDIFNFTISPPGGNNVQTHYQILINFGAGEMKCIKNPTRISYYSIASFNQISPVVSNNTVINISSIPVEVEHDDTWILKPKLEAGVDSFAFGNKLYLNRKKENNVYHFFHTKRFGGSFKECYEFDFSPIDGIISWSGYLPDIPFFKNRYESFE